jgi:hypothetical protein
MTEGVRQEDKMAISHLGQEKSTSEVNMAL